MSLQIGRIVLLFFVLSSYVFASDSFTVMSYNILLDYKKNKYLWEERKPYIAEQIQRIHPDFVGLQEPFLHQIDYILQNTNNYAYLGFATDSIETKGEINALLYDSSKFVLVASDSKWFSETPEYQSKTDSITKPRNYTYGVFISKKINQDTLHIVTTHFDHKSSKARLFSANQIINTFKSTFENHKFIFMGDLNAKRETPPILKLQESLKNASLDSSKKVGPLGTMNFFKIDKEPQMQLDYIFYYNLDLVKYIHIDEKIFEGNYPSDHLPIYAEFK